MTIASLAVISAALLRERAVAMRHSDITNLLGQGDGYI